jgi:large subunit ribosomal protein L18
LATNGHYRVKLRRRREGKTDYQARKALVSSGRPRLIVRASLRNITVQIAIAKPHGDEVLAAANSRELGKTYGWKAPTGNISSAYLTGYLCGLKAKAAGIKESILDIGLIAPTKGAKVFAALSGIVDAGVDVPHSEEKIVKERMKGEHIAKYAKSLGVGSEEYNAKFSKYIAASVAPEKLPEHFTKVKAEITAVFKGGKPAVEAEAEVKEAPKKKAVKAPKEKASKAAKEKAVKAPKEKVSKKGGKKE